jgi:hypothetical protein
MTTLSRSASRALHVLLLAAAAILFGLHFAHLTADFPNHSRWMDWSKYTDEGWYGDAAIRHFELGHWYVAGDFNPAAALPVLPLVESVVFSFTGVSLAAVRGLTVEIFGCILVACWILVSRRRADTPGGSLTAPLAVLMLAANPFCFVFTRMAIIEPLLVLVTLLALLAAMKVRAPDVSSLRQGVATLRPAVALGILLPLMVLMPGIFWILFASAGYRVRAFVRLALAPVLLGISLWSIYFLAAVRPHYLLDYRYLFSANAYTGMTRQNFVSVLALTVKDGSWMGPIFYPLALAAAFLALARYRRLAAHPLIVALLLWSAGYAAFLAYHNNLQPRYYLVIAVPLTLLLPVVGEDLVLPLFRRHGARAAAWAIASLAIAAVVIPDAVETIQFVRKPEYTLVQAAKNLAGYIRQDQKTDPGHNPLILSISGSDISLITGLPSICDDFGTLELVDRVKKYKPGWYAAWNQVEDDKLDAMAPHLRLERVAAWPAMDDPDRNLLILYKLLPAESPQTNPPPGRRPPTPRPLRTRVGQQPSVNQLVH